MSCNVDVPSCGHKTAAPDDTFPSYISDYFSVLAPIKSCQMEGCDLAIMTPPSQFAF